MMTSFEKAVEILSGEDGVSVTVRPLFPFLAEGFRIGKRKDLEVFGEGKLISLAIPEEIRADVLAAENITLCEFPMVGAQAVRELILDREMPAS